MNRYPPYIEGTIPAFCSTKKGTVITVPFSMNRGVSKNEINGFYLKIKTVQDSSYFLTLHSSDFDINSKFEVYFSLNEEQVKKLNLGQHYKIQLAYNFIDGGVGLFSTVGIIKYTTMPEISIEGLKKNISNIHTYDYIGHYSQLNGDTSEKEYSYQFVIYDKLGNIVDKTDFLIHNNSNDENSYESIDTFSFSQDLQENSIYYIQYNVLTNNNMLVSSPRYKIVQHRSILPEEGIELFAASNYENGYVELTLKTPKDNEGFEIPLNGLFVISRTNNDTNFSQWEEVLRLTFYSDHASRWSWKDFTIEQGKDYIYSIQQYNDYGLYSERILSKASPFGKAGELLYVDFEDAFLFDGERQLKIKYNPKISSFKTNYLESKVDTIGSKHPFIFRNGNVEYKEFPISGLISYQSDEENLFMSDDILGFSKNIANLERKNTLNDKEPILKDDMSINEKQEIIDRYEKDKNERKAIANNKNRTLNLVGYNFSAERDFKLNVLNWLNNGKPKVFKSPSEGNYIVRLMNSSLSPEEGLGRMLHTFNCTAYEVADYNYNNLVKYGFISTENSQVPKMMWKTIRLNPYYEDFDTTKQENGWIELLNKDIIKSVKFIDLLPGDKIKVNNQEILIGATGNYIIENSVDITSIKIPNRGINQGQVTYGYYDTKTNSFDRIRQVKIKDVVSKQFISNSKVVEQIEDSKTLLANFYYLHFEERGISQAYVKYDTEGFPYKNNENTLLYRDPKGTTLIYNDLKDKPSDLFEDPFLLYTYDCDQIYLKDINEEERGFIGYGWVQLNHTDFNLPENQLKDRYWIIENNEFVNVMEFNSDLKQDKETNQGYFVKKPYTFYYDSFNPTIYYVNQETYENISLFAEIYQIEILDKIEVYNNKIIFNNDKESEKDLTEIKTYYIDSIQYFDEIEIGCGVVLNCGYEAQELIYSIEYQDPSLNTQRTLLDTLQSILIYTYKDFEEKDEEFKKLCESANIYSNEKIKERFFADMINMAADKYNNLYPKYEEELKLKLIELEDN